MLRQIIAFKKNKAEEANLFVWIGRKAQLPMSIKMFCT